LDIFNRGIFNEAVLRDDLKRITDYYKLKGFTDVRVAAEQAKERKGIAVIIRIDEGKPYHIGRVAIEGNEQVPLEDINAALTVKESGIYSEQVMYEGANQIRPQQHGRKKGSSSCR